MSEIIRRAKIVIDLEQGQVKLDAPDLSQVLATKDEQIAKERDLMAAIEEATKLEEKLAQERIENNSKAAEQARKASEEQRRAALDIAKNSAEALAGVTQLGEGFFLLGRSATLFAADTNEGLQEMVQSLATVQAGFDLFKGTVQAFQGAVAVIEKLNAARKAQAVVTAAATAAEGAHAAALTTSTGAAVGLTAAMGPLGIALAAAAAVIAVVAVAYKQLADAERDAEEAAKKAQEDARARRQEMLEIEQRVLDAWAERRRSLAEEATAQEKLEMIEQRRKQLERPTESITGDLARFGESGVVERRIRTAEEMQDLAREELAVRREIADERQRELQSQVQVIEQQQRAVEAAERALEIEQAKERSFAAQFGQLSRIEQERLKEISAKVEAGQDLTGFEERELRRIGGERGRQVADDIAAERGAEAGASRVLSNLGGDDGLRSAQRDVANARANLGELTDGASADSAIRQLQQQQRELLDQQTEFTDNFRDSMRLLSGAVLDFKEELRQLGVASVGGGR